jgi:hypothetical protein
MKVRVSGTGVPLILMHVEDLEAVFPLITAGDETHRRRSLGTAGGFVPASGACEAAK